MNLNDKQRSYRNIFIGFVVGSILYELGYFLIKGRTSLESTPFVIVGAFIGSIIGMIITREK